MHEHTNCRRGFTMIELMVTVSIFALVSSVLLANYPKFSSRILLENTAHLIGLSVRQAQTYGLNVRGTRLDGADVFPTYGVHFGFADQKLTANDPSDDRHFVLFADVYTNPPDGDTDMTNNDKIYNAVTACDGTGGECADVFVIQGAERIVSLLGYATSGECATGCPLVSLDVAYTRPNPDATIKGKRTSGGVPEQFSSGKIVVQSPRGDQKSIVVQSTGQIVVE